MNVVGLIQVNWQAKSKSRILRPFNLLLDGLVYFYFFFGKVS